MLLAELLLESFATSESLEADFSIGVDSILVSVLTGLVGLLVGGLLVAVVEGCSTTTSEIESEELSLIQAAAFA